MSNQDENVKQVLAAKDARIKELEALLRYAEWVEDSDGRRHCPWCTQTEPVMVAGFLPRDSTGHKPDCPYLALKEKTDE
jgi:hypothetical protein